MSFSSEIENLIITQNQNYKIKNILHIGACLGEEIDFYERLSPETIYWFEPNPKLLEKLKNNLSRKNFENIVFPYAVSSKKGKANFNIIEDDAKTNPGCSSLAELKIHSELYGHIKKVGTCEVETINIDEFLQENNLKTEFQLVSLDTQGHDFEILNSSNIILNSKIIIIETAKVELYEGQKIDSEIESFLKTKGYNKEYYHAFHDVWGDTVYIKN
jgi:FkbM family methyltransferase